MSFFRGLIAICLIVGIWLAGFVVFVDRVVDSTPSIEPSEKHDGIVVLTGASNERLSEGMELLERRKAKRMLISGVNEKVKRHELMELTKGSKRLYNCCVDLGYEAQTTLGNALEIGKWAKDHDYKTLIVVTSDYHMPRALLEIKGAARGVSLTPYAVASNELDAKQWHKSEKATRRIFLEYNKFLAIMVRDGVNKILNVFDSDAPKDAANDLTPVAKS